MPVLGLDSGYTVKYTPQPSDGGVYYGYGYRYILSGIL